MSLILKLLVVLGVVTPPPPPKAFLPVPTPLQRTRSFATKALETSSNKLSPGRKQVLTILIVDTALRSFETQEHREFWIALIGAESGYDGNVRSPVGAVGLGQLLPPYKEDFGKRCGLRGFDANDLRDDATNLALSACFFRTLVETAGSVPLALVHYNAGQNGQAAKAALSGTDMNAQTANYATKIWISREGK